MLLKRPVKQKVGYGNRRAPCFAYAILCHESSTFVAEQFEFLWHPENFYFYHVDLKGSEALHNLVAKLAGTYGNVFVVPSLLCSWGGFSLVEATLRLLAWAVKKAGAWSHFILLSEQHLPLVDQLELEHALEIGRSYLACVPLEAFRDLPRADLLHRFAGDYFEVPGVGSFRVGAPSFDRLFIEKVHHGSQWMVLARPACESLVKDENAEFWERFKGSLFSDETAIQTWFRHHLDKRFQNYDNRNMSFIAAPIDGGSPDMIFNEANYFTAKEKGFLFIRKRPTVLAARVRDNLELIKKYPGGKPPVPQTANVHAREIGSPCGHIVDSIFLYLNFVLGQSPFGTRIARFPPQVPGPAFFGLVESDTGIGDLLLLVVSGDLITFKVVATTNASANDYAEPRHQLYDTTVLKVRGYQLCHHREVHVGKDMNAGIVTASSLQDLRRVAAMIDAYIDRLKKLPVQNSSPEASSPL